MERDSLLKSPSCSPATKSSIRGCHQTTCLQKILRRKDKKKALPYLATIKLSKQRDFLSKLATNTSNGEKGFVNSKSCRNCWWTQLTLIWQKVQKKYFDGWITDFEISWNWSSSCIFFGNLRFFKNCLCCKFESLPKLLLSSLLLISIRNFASTLLLLRPIFLILWRNLEALKKT